jgi:hypothetical protein
MIGRWLIGSILAAPGTGRSLAARAIAKIVVYPSQTGGRRALSRTRGTPIVLTAAATLALVLISSAPAQARPVLSWSTPQVIDTSAGPVGVFSVACPWAFMCVAVDRPGNVVTTTDPNVGRSAWKSVNVDGTNFIDGVWCPSARLCVTDDSDGNVLTSTNPTGPASAWNLTPVDTAGTGLYGIFCQSPRLCILGDANGNILASTDPGGGAQTWSAPQHIDGTNTIFSVSCPSIRLCVAVDSGGNMLTSTEPTGGLSAWQVTHVDDTPGGLSAVSCPSPRLCVADDIGGNVLISTDPTGGPSAWKIADSDGGHPLFDMSCQSARLCIAVGPSYGPPNFGGPGIAVIGTA